MDISVSIGVQLLNAESGETIADEQVIISDTTDEIMRSALSTWLSTNFESLLSRLPENAWIDGDPGGTPRGRFATLTWNWLFWCWITAASSEIQEYERTRIYTEGARAIKAQVDSVSLGTLHGII